MAYMFVFCPRTTWTIDPPGILAHLVLERSVTAHVDILNGAEHDICASGGFLFRLLPVSGPNTMLIKESCLWFCFFWRRSAYSHWSAMTRRMKLKYHRVKDSLKQITYIAQPSVYSIYILYKVTIPYSSTFHDTLHAFALQMLVHNIHHAM